MKGTKVSAHSRRRHDDLFHTFSRAMTPFQVRRIPFIHAFNEVTCERIRRWRLPLMATRPQVKTFLREPGRRSAYP